MNSNNVENSGFIGKQIYDSFKILLGDNPVQGVISIVSFICGLVLIGYGVIGLVKALLLWLGGANKKEWGEQAIGGIIAIGLGAALSAVVAYLVSRYSS